MKRIFVFTVSLMFVNVIYAQEVCKFQYSISYDMYINFGHRTLNKAELAYSNTSSCYTYKPLIDYTITKGSKEDDERNITIGDTASHTIWCDKAMNEVIEMSGTGKILIMDSISAIKWEIQNDMRNIDGFRCNKAIGIGG